MEQLLYLKKIHDGILDLIATFERDRVEMEVIRIQRNEEIEQLKSDLAKIRQKIDDNKELYKAYLDRIKKDDVKIQKMDASIFELKREIKRKKNQSSSRS